MTSAIRVENLGKCYRVGQNQQRGGHTFRDSIVDAVKAPFARLLNGTRVQATDEFWALNDVSFEVRPGEVIGIIGRNGAGKSTLLKILSRITKPTTGRVELNGRVGSLLEVGTGFHPELSGRENIFLNGSILGMSKFEIARKFDEIVDFAEIEKFLDTPVKRYSSGMYVRLAFAVAAHLEPEILIVDEVLAVGDAGFQKKCLGKMGETARHGRTILFVSHSLSAMSSLTSRCIYLESGRVHMIGPTAQVVAEYMNRGFSSSACWAATTQTDHPIQVLAAQVGNGNGVLSSELDVEKDIVVTLEYVVRRAVEGSVVGIVLHASDGALLLSSEDADASPELLTSRKPGRYRVAATIPRGLLNKGDFYIRIVSGVPGQQQFDNVEALRFALLYMGNHMPRGNRTAYFIPDLPPWSLQEIETANGEYGVETANKIGRERTASAAEIRQRGSGHS